MKTVQNDLYDYGMKIFQLEEGFKFSLDSLLLAEFIKPHNDKQKILDLCTGNAAVPLVLTTKYINKITGIELQKEIYNLALKSVICNHKEDQIMLINDNVKNLLNYLDYESIDIISCNPPYFKHQSSSIINEEKIKAIARHEITITLAELITISGKLLKNNGDFYLIHRAERLEEIINILSSQHLIIKEVVPIYTSNNKNASLILVHCIKNAKKGLKILPAIYTNKLKTFKNLF